MDTKIDYLIKIGGSLIEKSNDFDTLVNCLADLGKDKTIIITTGSKDLSDKIRQYINDILGNTIPMETHLEINMQARDYVSSTFSHSHSSFIATDSVSSTRDALTNKKVPILKQYSLFQNLQPFELQRGLTGDTMSAYFAHIFNVDKFIKLTNVDGVYRNFETDKAPCAEISASTLKKIGKTCTDRFLPDILKQLELKCYVMNGRNTKNLENFMENNEGVYTTINPN